ncbi:MAG: hypothetical protein SNJ84_07810, partial [Verrucomicrobiia bacterium]
TFALGLGAPASTPPGEFLSIHHTHFFLPPDGAGSPDFLRPPAERPSTISSFYGARFSGQPALVLRFTQKTPPTAISWTELVQTVGDHLNVPRLGLILLAETNSIVGASLIAPLDSRDPAPFDFPQIRDTLTFTTEPAFTRHLALAVAWVERTASPVQPFLRPLTPAASWSVHAHAVIFPYRPLPRDLIELPPFLDALLAEDSPEALLHLLNDPRPDGVGDSSFSRGVLWAGPITTLEGNTP